MRGFSIIVATAAGLGYVKYSKDMHDFELRIRDGETERKNLKDEIKWLRDDNKELRGMVAKLKEEKEMENRKKFAELQRAFKTERNKPFFKKLFARVFATETPEEAVAVVEEMTDPSDPEKLKQDIKSMVKMD